MKARFIVAIAVAVALMTGLTSAAATFASAASPAAAYTCTDKIGCVTIAPNAPIHIAYMLVTSGANSTLGLDSEYGAQIAVDDAGGKLLGHPIQFDGQDDGCTAEGGQTAASKVASDKTVVAVIGDSCSSSATPAAPIITNAGLTMVSPSATAPSLTDPAKHVAGFLRVAYNDKTQGAVAAQFVYNQLHLTRAATIHDGSPYAQQLQQVFADTFKQLGGTITDQEAINVGDKDMKPVLTKIAGTQPQLLYFPIFVAEGGAIANQIRGVPGMEKVVMMGADGIFTPDFLKAGGPNTVGMFWSSPDFSSFGSAYKSFLAKYAKKYNLSSPIAPYHAHAYDAMNMILAAIKKVAVQDPDGTVHIGRQALRDALFATKDLPGLTGNLTCDQYGDCGAKIVAIFQLTQQEYASLQMPSTPVWKPGGPDYRAPTASN